MASIIKILRRFQAPAGAPPEAGRQEGELFANLQGTRPELWVFGGNSTSGTAPANKGWMRINDDPTIAVVSKSIAGTANPAADGNAQAAATNVWPWVVNAGEVPIVTHNGTSYAFTGGVGSWGTTSGGTALTAGMFTALGAAPGAPEVYDWSARGEADLGAAYTAAGVTFGTGLVVVQWKDGQTYVLTNPAAPGTAASYTAVATSSPDQPITVVDWTGAAYTGAATIDAAYNVWAAAATTNRFNSADVTIVRYGSPAANYLVTNPAAPTNANSYFEMHHPVQSLAFTASYDITAAFDPAAMTPANIGDFGIVSTSGTLIDNAPGDQWPIRGATPGTSTFSQGDMLIWDGSEFIALASEMDLSAYLPLAGGTMTDTATVTFAVPAGAAPATPTVRIDGGDPAKSSLDNFMLDAGVF